ncbi:uncharacterized protein BCR38DRAFT_331454 [Pseudomassariella vexata]|uniref:BZIP domain-containing protein n=1 Tax=Pseudomassariella vexata TaxID=1141098 RepID=A0A1Y2EKW0_9PEZI|nr:uncharacterized protein BCR38DRAFT_331454 [Pseudomassariella vexata]ORY72161.1 hypothetical protein BCR38DRAFT_331454 [Pseudomassariella vexata]
MIGMAAVAIGQSQMPKSITSREWVVPPRPKPGRKPATDTPPTKRKAQNRAAQRAFRERRAARVGELEEQLDEQREEHERIEQDLRNRVQGLDLEVQTLRDRCMQLEDMLQKERADRARVSNELDSVRRRWRDERDSTSTNHLQHSMHPSPRASNACEHRNSAISISQIISPPDPSSEDQPMTDVGCGSCDPNGPCACIEEVLIGNNTVTSLECGRCSLGTKYLKRGPSPTPDLAPDEKRHKSISNANENEIDFTAMFSRKPRRTPAATETAVFQPVAQAVAIHPRDSCGFCKEGTYCMCAEAAAAAAAQQTLPPMGSQSQVQTPPPSENDVVTFPAPATGAYEVTATGAVKLPSLFGRDRQKATIPEASKAGGCGVNGPGTCAQCLSDPKSGLFCRSLAASAERQGKSGGCCGGSAGGGCCKSGNANDSSSRAASPTSISLSCADAYKTLASHRNFDRAADEIGTWLPKLRAVPMEIEDAARPGERGPGPRHVGRGSGIRGRCPIEVETASIMSVLKGFDVRFGRDA